MHIKDGKQRKLGLVTIESFILDTFKTLRSALDAKRVTTTFINYHIYHMIISIFLPENYYKINGYLLSEFDRFTPTAVWLFYLEE